MVGINAAWRKHGLQSSLDLLGEAESRVGQTSRSAVSLDPDFGAFTEMRQPGVDARLTV
jgi:hypothetical protein